MAVKYFITGISGFVGGELAITLANQGLLLVVEVCHSLRNVFIFCSWNVDTLGLVAAPPTGLVMITSSSWLAGRLKVQRLMLRLSVGAD